MSPSMRFTPRAATWSAKFRDGRQRVAGERPRAIGNGARGEVGVAAAYQPQRAGMVPCGVRRLVGHHAGLEA